MDLTAVVLSATNQAVSGRTVTFSVGAAPTGAAPETAFTNNFGTGGLVSDVNGLVTAKLNLGGNKANRTIMLSAAADAATATNSVDVIGTALTISGNSSLAFGATTTLTFSVKDSAGNPLQNTVVSIASQTGNTIVQTPTTGITNGAGQITAAITASKTGNDVITASAAGASATQALTVSSDTFVFTPLANTDIQLGTAQPISISWTTGGVPRGGKPVNFSSSRGSVSLSTVNTDPAGNASVTVSSATTAGPAIITASDPSGTPAATLNVTFVATSASSITAQAVPGTIAFTTGSASQTNNSSTISVVVRDSNNNLVKNASVNFTITADPSGGKLTSSNVITDVSGSASVTYVAGATSSPLNGVVIAATVTSVNGVPLGTPISGTTSLTVAGQANLVSLGTDNLVGGTAPNNTKTYIAIVTDTAGTPVAGVTVSFSLRPGRFMKGHYILVPPGSPTGWGQTATTTCNNEDLLFDGIIHPGEDLNGNGKLDPGGVATVNATGVTDVNGIATATITYAKDHSNWAEVTLVARTGVAGNDPPTTATFFLPGLAADYTNIGVAPPGQTSPYGFGADTLCTTTN